VKTLNPNVDFYSASTCTRSAFRCTFTPIFAVAASRLDAHVLEQYDNNRLIRPRAESWAGYPQRYVPVDALISEPRRSRIKSRKHES
jgi:citrate synthase